MCIRDSSKTLARPEFRELTFTPYYRVEDRMITYTKFGDYVKQSKITNWDLRFEWYPSMGCLLYTSWRTSSDCHEVTESMVS